MIFRSWDEIQQVMRYTSNIKGNFTFVALNMIWTIINIFLRVSRIKILRYCIFSTFLKSLDINILSTSPCFSTGRQYYGGWVIMVSDWSGLSSALLWLVRLRLRAASEGASWIGQSWALCHLLRLQFSGDLIQDSHNEDNVWDAMQCYVLFVY